MPTYTRHALNGTPASGMGLFGLTGTTDPISQSTPGHLLHTCPSGAVDIVSLKANSASAKNLTVWVSGSHGADPFVSIPGSLPSNLLFISTPGLSGARDWINIFAGPHSAQTLTVATAPSEGTCTLFPGDVLYLVHNNSSPGSYITFNGYVNRITGQ